MKDLDAGFGTVEKRIKDLLKENADLRKRVEGLERELSAARAESRELQNFKGKQLHIREKVEKVLRQLEAMGEQGA